MSPYLSFQFHVLKRSRLRQRQWNASVLYYACVIIKRKIIKNNISIWWRWACKKGTESEPPPEGRSAFRALNQPWWAFSGPVAGKHAWAICWLYCALLSQQVSTTATGQPVFHLFTKPATILCGKIWTKGILAERFKITFALSLRDYFKRFWSLITAQSAVRWAHISIAKGFSSSRKNAFSGRNSYKLCFLTPALTPISH